MAAEQVEAVYNMIFKDPRVRKALDTISPYLPVASKFITIVLGTGVASEIISFVVLPMIDISPGGIAARAIATAVESTIRNAITSPESIFQLLQSLGTAAAALPALLIGTMTAGNVLAVKVLSDIKELAAKANGVVKIIDDAIQNLGAGNQGGTKQVKDGAEQKEDAEEGKPLETKNDPLPISYRVYVRLTRQLESQPLRAKL